MSTYIDVVIAMFMAFLTASLLVTALTEILASFLKLRAGVLKTALSEILGGGSDSSIRDNFYKNNLMLGMTKDPDRMRKWLHPSYIAGQAFARSLLQAVVDSEEGLEANAPPLAERSLEEVRMLATKVKYERLRVLLLGLISDTKKSVADLEKDLSDWFDMAMARLSGRFKRMQQGISFAVGLLVAASLNLDVIRLASDVYADEVLSAQFVSLATNFVDGGLPDTATGSALVDNVNAYAEDIVDFALGWPSPYAPDAENASLPLYWLWHLPGWIMVALATTLGAPFWFDLLSRFVRIRGTGGKPETEQYKT